MTSKVVQQPELSDVAFGAERDRRVRREAEVIAKGMADIDAGLGIEDEAMEAWLDALEHDEASPLPIAGGRAERI